MTQEAAEAAAYLHDVLEDTAVTPSEMRTEFGDSITELVLEVTDVSTPGDGNRATRKEIDRNHLRKASYLGKSIKLADLIDNTHSIVSRDPGFAEVYMKEKALLLSCLSDGNKYLLREARELVEDYFSSKATER